ncbi:unnamed protein product [Periconia digitata]|uniref:Uncharacterized protein n=1 Tax=Periconia digitata TaxID=1303443 RepID=A0A9W4U5G5_9PLEO|nr:unnamed protein product [Periconia digitata]
MQGYGYPDKTPSLSLREIEDTQYPSQALGALVYHFLNSPTNSFERLCLSLSPALQSYQSISSDVAGSARYL